jgi:hypothetical protein
MPAPEANARQQIDRALTASGWAVLDIADANLDASRGVAIREFPLTSGHGFADYVLFVDGRAAGVIEAKKAGTTLTGVELQAAKYSAGFPDAFPAHLRPLPFLYQSTGLETRFSSRLDPEPRSRRVFQFHQPLTRRRMSMIGTLLNCDEAVRFIEQIQDPVTKNLVNMAFVHLVKRVHLEKCDLPMTDLDMLFLVTSLKDFFAEHDVIARSRGRRWGRGLMGCDLKQVARRTKKGWARKAGCWASSFVRRRTRSRTRPSSSC